MTYNYSATQNNGQRSKWNLASKAAPNYRAYELAD